MTGENNVVTGGSALDLVTALAVTDRNRGYGYDGYGDCFGGSGGGLWALIILFFIMGIGGNGFGGFGGWGNGNLNQITNDFLYTNLNTTLGQGFTQLTNQNFNIERALCQGFAGVQRDISDVNHNLDSCCCGINRNIDAVRYENAKNTCDIINAGNANTQRIIDTITHNEMQTLRDNLQAANLQLGQLSQTSTLINTLRPTPIPAYVTCSPYASAYYGSGYNWGNGCNSCGCGF